MPDWTLPEVWLSAAAFCTGKDLATLGATCQALSAVVRTPELWRSACEQWAPGMPQFSEWAAAWKRAQELGTARPGRSLPLWGSCFYADSKQKASPLSQRCLCLSKGGMFKSQSSNDYEASQHLESSENYTKELQPRIFDLVRRITFDTFFLRLKHYTAPRTCIDWWQLFHEKLKPAILASAAKQESFIAWDTRKHGNSANITQGVSKLSTEVQASAVLPIDKCRLVWKIAMDELLDKRIIRLEHKFGQNGDLCMNNVKFKVRLSLPETEVDEPCLEFWARQTEAPFGGFQVRLVRPLAKEQQAATPASGGTQSVLPSGHEDKEDVVGNVWTTSGVEWGWNSLLSSMQQLNEFVAPEGFLYFDVRWFCESPDVASCTQEGVCSYRVTGPTYTAQPWFFCRTCGLDDNYDEREHRGCCLACADICHRGHDVRPQGISASFCDCGGSSLGTLNS